MKLQKKAQSSIQHVQKWLKLTRNNNYWSRVHDCTKISNGFVSEKMCFKERKVCKETWKCYLKKKNPNKTTQNKTTMKKAPKT